ncbi:hypothetical protein DFH08DRAFT_966131 [Mycena albidolilacea]|uniref:Uncharacterized protein n=1 Tax=Mycena albidolilacea TaxID=1033008 RepID=A0AAD7ELF0_9AGAR|nr:hypothetical protein DFH08DRAFT_966131 [Mycena albidolilacea]
MSLERCTIDSEPPKLPRELERHIFELSATADRTSIPKYLRVAHRVHVWIEPILYNILLLQGPDERRPVRADQLPLSPVDYRDAAFLASHVHHLNLSGALPHDQLRTLLSACTGTRTLALWSPLPRPGPNLLPLLQAMPRLTRLSADVTHLCGGPLRLDIAHAAFAALTHLDVLAAPFDDWRLCAGLARAPALTHLTFRDKFHPSVLRGALAHCRGLRAVGVIWSARKSAVDVREGEVVDVRLFMTICRDWVEDWETSVNGGWDIWARAEAFIAQKEAGEIKASRLWFK